MGCFEAAQTKAQDNMVAIGGVAVAILLPQVGYNSFAHGCRVDIPSFICVMLGLL